MIKREYRKTAEIYPVQSIRVIDGDTIEANILLPFRTTITRRIRLKGWWADETTGPWAAQGQAAAKRLSDWLDLRAVWLHAPSCREDKYGRVIGHLMHCERIVDPKEVLGPYQLTEAEHKRRRDEADKRKLVPPGPPLVGGGMGTAEPQSGCVLGHPGSFSGPLVDHDDETDPSLVGDQGTLDDNRYGPGAL